MTDDLVAFLRARLHDDEQTARAVRQPDDYRWEAWHMVGEATEGTVRWGVRGAGVQPEFEDQLNKARMLHIARHDPARVLADTDAKRELLADVLAESHFRNEEDNWYSCAALVDEDGEPVCLNDTRAPGPCDCGRDDRVGRRLRLLARPYADHPDYRPEWRPQANA